MEVALNINKGCDDTFGVILYQWIIKVIFNLINEDFMIDRSIIAFDIQAAEIVILRCVQMPIDTLGNFSDNGGSLKVCAGI